MLLPSLWLVLGACSGSAETPLGGLREDPPPTTSFLPFDGPGPTNLIFVSIDTLRRDHLDRYGDRGLTPFLDGLMDEGVPLDAHQACSNWTYPGILCALSGQDSVSLGFVPRLSKTYRESLPDGTAMLPDWLREEGFGSALVSTNGYLSDKWNTAQGYDTVVYPGFEPALDIVDRSMILLDDLHGDHARWFLHLHLRDAHAPYDPPAAYLGALEDLPPIDYDLSDWDSHYNLANAFLSLDEEDRALLLQHLTVRYEAAVHYTDDALRHLWSELDRRGVLENTMVVFWSDHGEQFWEHGRQTHAWSLNYGENDAFALFWSPELTPGAWTGPTTQEDLVPTVFEALGLAQRPEFTGLPVGAAAEDRVLFFTSDGRVGPEQGVQQSGTKLDYFWTGDKSLYRRTTDPLETQDVYDPEDPEVIALWEHLGPYVARSQALLPEKTPVNAAP